MRKLNKLGAGQKGKGGNRAMMRGWVGIAWGMSGVGMMDAW